MSTPILFIWEFHPLPPPSLSGFMSLFGCLCYTLSRRLQSCCDIVPSQIGANNRCTRTCNWPLPIEAFQDQCKQIMINKRRRRQLLEEEIDKLRRESAVAGYVQRRLFWQEEESISTYFLYLFQDSFFLCFENYTFLVDWKGWGSWTEMPVFWMDTPITVMSSFTGTQKPIQKKVKLLEEAMQCLLPRCVGTRGFNALFTLR